MKTITCDLCGKEITEEDSKSNAINLDTVPSDNDWYKLIIRNVTRNVAMENKDICDECRYGIFVFLESIKSSKGLLIRAARETLSELKKRYADLR